MNVFGDFAEYYDLFYREKDYAAEAAFVAGLLRRNSPGACTLLELGCGTARHAVELVNLGFTIHGIDRSVEMVKRAQAAAALLPAEARDLLTAATGDVTSYAPDRIYDAVISLFHVINYQVTRPALEGMFRTARSAVDRGGLFVFDYWYGPAVLTDPPATRIRRMKTGEFEVTRLAEPRTHPNRNMVDVGYTLFVLDRSSGAAKVYEEIHSMRYLFLPELQAFAEDSGFEIIGTGAWLSTEPLSQKTWLGWAVARAV
jgi:SAM-dependent methyltransferase